MNLTPKNDMNVNGNLSKMKQYGQMAKSFMNKPFNHPNDIVGNYEWHQQFPYEYFLLNERKWAYDTNQYEMVPIFNDYGGLKAVDFGCGPGRMIQRMYNTNLFERVDGIDVSDYALDYAKGVFPKSNFYSSTGYDVGNAPSDEYDLVYSTIAMQHIACRSIRLNLFREFNRILLPHGRVSLQFAFNPTMEAGKYSHDTEHVEYMSDAFDATATNGHADFILNTNSIRDFMVDLSDYFDDVSMTFERVDDKYHNLNGAYHSPYWAQSWCFVHGHNT